MSRKEFLVLLTLCFVSYYINGLSEATVINDYHFVPETYSFYKFHNESINWDEAMATCEEEGATLFFPGNDSELNAVDTFWQKKKNKLSECMLIGIKKIGNDFKTISGIPISSVYNKWYTGEPNNKLGNENCVEICNRRNVWSLHDILCSHNMTFMCKAKNLWSEECNLPDFGYRYSEPMGKCYKFHLSPQTWNEARNICREEDSDLAVINSNEEAAYLVRLTNKINHSIPGNFTHSAILLGFHKQNVEDWQTIQGKSLYYSGYACWGNRQPDGGDREKCGAMFYNGHLTDIACDRKALFICEHNVVNANVITEPDPELTSIQCYDSI